MLRMFVTEPCKYRIARPDERLNAHLKRLAVERKSPEVQVRPEGRGDGELISDRSIGSDVQRPIGDIGGSGIDKLELRPPHCLELLDGGFLEEALWLGPSKGESRIVPPECQVEIGLEGLASLGSSGQICEEKPGRDLERQLARRQPGFICLLCSGGTGK